MIKNKKHKVIIVQRTCPHYMVPIYQRIAQLSNVDLLVYYGYYMNKRYEKLKNTEVITEFKNKKLFTISFPIKLRNQIFPVFIFPTLLPHLFKDKPNVIICEGEANLINDFIIFVYSKVKQIPYIWWSLGRIRANKPSILRKSLNPLIRFLLNHSSAILGYSSFTKNFYSQEYKIKKDKIFVAYNCVDTDKVKTNIEKFKPFIQKEKEKLGLINKKIILFVGSFSTEKKIENLILAYELIKKEQPNVALLLVGDGETKKKMESLVKEKQLTDVIFVGRKIEDVSLYFLIGDVFVLPGEGGLAINEAMIHGLPIVTVPADGTELDMVIEGKNGYIVEKNNILELAKAVVKILGDDSLRSQMSIVSKELVNTKFNMNNMLANLSLCIKYATDNKIH
jgi:glycosyltransferase involved in cell wall biosynthesis